MPRRESPLNREMLPGTPDMLVFRTLVLGAAHGYTIERESEDVLQLTVPTARTEQAARAIGRILKPATE